MEHMGYGMIFQGLHRETAPLNLSHPSDRYLKMPLTVSLYHDYGVKTTLIQFVVGMFTLPSHGWFMTLFYPHWIGSTDVESRRAQPLG